MRLLHGSVIRSLGIPIIIEILPRGSREGLPQFMVLRISWFAPNYLISKFSVTFEVSHLSYLDVVCISTFILFGHGSLL
jgi:hypothetical protein